jgi:hypothetical protein
MAPILHQPSAHDKAPIKDESQSDTEEDETDHDVHAGLLLYTG